MPVLTAAGKAKIVRLTEALRTSVAEGVETQARVGRNLAAEYAPSATEEAELLSKGTARDGISTGYVVGTPEGGRFLRIGAAGEAPIRDVIATDPVRVVEGPDGITRGLTGFADRINSLTGFSWLTKRGLAGPTYPFNHAYVQALEDGGAVWTVVPREQNYLNPEPGISTTLMTKTLPPIRMFARAREARRSPGKFAFAETVRRALKRASGGVA